MKINGMTVDEGMAKLLGKVMAQSNDEVLDNESRRRAREIFDAGIRATGSFEGALVYVMLTGMRMAMAPKRKRKARKATANGAQAEAQAAT